LHNAGRQYPNEQSHERVGSGANELLGKPSTKPLESFPYQLNTYEKKVKKEQEEQYVLQQ
jgi:hypothetical protein